MNLNVRWGIETDVPYKDGGWNPLWKRDSCRIEQAYQSAEPSPDGSSTKVCIRNTHAMADIEGRLVTENYNEFAPARKLVRGTWFWKHPAAMNSSGSGAGKVGKLVAFSEEIAARAEEWHSGVKEDVLRECMQLSCESDDEESEVGSVGGPGAPAGGSSSGGSRAKANAHLPPWVLPLGELMGPGNGQYKLVATRNAAGMSKFRRSTSAAALNQAQGATVAASTSENLQNLASAASLGSAASSGGLTSMPSDGDIPAAGTVDVGGGVGGERSSNYSPCSLAGSSSTGSLTPPTADGTAASTVITATSTEGDATGAGDAAGAGGSVSTMPMSRGGSAAEGVGASPTTVPLAATVTELYSQLTSSLATSASAVADVGTTKTPTTSVSNSNSDGNSGAAIASSAAAPPEGASQAWLKSFWSVAPASATTASSSAPAPAGSSSLPPAASTSTNSGGNLRGSKERSGSLESGDGDSDGEGGVESGGLFLVDVALVRSINVIADISVASYPVYRGFHDIHLDEATAAERVKGGAEGGKKNSRVGGSGSASDALLSREELEERWEWGGDARARVKGGGASLKVGKSIPPSAVAGGALDDTPTGQLIFVVHGIGESLWSAKQQQSSKSSSSPAAASSEQQQQAAVQAAAADGAPVDFAAANMLQSFSAAVDTFSALCQECVTEQYDSGRRIPTVLPSWREAQASASARGGIAAAGIEGCTAGATAESRPAASRYRVDCIAIEWHDCIHAADLQLTKRIRSITSPGVALMRAFGNAAAVDLLTYQSPLYQQRVLRAVSSRIARIYTRYCELNPRFTGRCSVVGHSLGSVIAFDTLIAQPAPSTTLLAPLPRRVLSTSNLPLAAMALGTGSPMTECSPPVPDSSGQRVDSSSPAAAARVSPGGTSASASAPAVVAPTLPPESIAAVVPLPFAPEHLFLVGSPVALFIAMRSDGALLPATFRLPTCPRLLNVYHPYDPVAYRMEPLVEVRHKAAQESGNSGARKSKKPLQLPLDPVIMEHHGGNYIHYQFRQFAEDINRGLLAVRDNLQSALPGWSGGSGTTNSKPQKQIQQQATAAPKTSVGFSLFGSQAASVEVAGAAASKSAASVPSTGGSVADPAATSSNWFAQVIGLGVTSASAAEREKPPKSAADEAKQKAAEEEAAAAVRAEADAMVCQSMDPEPGFYVLNSGSVTKGKDGEKEAVGGAGSNAASTRRLSKSGGGRMEAVGANAGSLGRLDHVLQESMLENSGSYLAAVASHSSYFDNKDVALFIVNQIHFGGPEEEEQGPRQGQTGVDV